MPMHESPAGVPTAHASPAPQEAWVAQVGAHFADLPAIEREDMMADVRAYAFEAETLPSAGEYAAELRAAAGYPPVGPTGRSGSELGWATQATQGLSAALAQVWQGLVTAVSPMPGGQWLVELLVHLRPAWWVLRGLAAGGALGAVVGVALMGVENKLALIGAVAGVPVSVWLGRHPSRAWWRSLAVLVANLICCWMILVVVSNWQQLMPRAVYNSSSPGYVEPPRTIENVFVYDKKGNLLRDVRIVDQDGQPLSLDMPTGSCAMMGYGHTGELLPPDSSLLYPVPQGQFDSSGNICKDLPAQPQVVLPPLPEASPTATAEPTATR